MILVLNTKNNKLNKINRIKSNKMKIQMMRLWEDKNKNKT